MADQSKTEAALAALASALAAAAAAPDAAIPVLMRNEILPTNFPQFAGAGFWLNLLDGNGAVDEKLLGNPDGVSNAYEITHRAALELAIEHADQATRDTLFDAALIADDDALIADRGLGGAVDYAEIETTQRTGLVFDGTPGVKAAEITIALSFVSPRPF